MSNLIFTEIGWDDYVYWETQDRKTLKKINILISDTQRNGHDGIGKPEPLSGELSGYWSKRINEKDRLIYKIEIDGSIVILSCKGHHEDK